MIVSRPGSRLAVLWAWEAEHEGGEGDGRWGQVAPARPQGCLVRGDGVPGGLARRGPPVGAPLPGWRPAPYLPIRGVWTSPEKEAGQAVLGAEGVTGAERRRRPERVSRALWARKCRFLACVPLGLGCQPCVCTCVREGVGCSPPVESLPNVLWSSPQRRRDLPCTCFKGLQPRRPSSWTRAFMATRRLSHGPGASSSSGGPAGPRGLRRSGASFPPSVDSSPPSVGCYCLEVGPRGPLLAPLQPGHYGAWTCSLC